MLSLFGADDGCIAPAMCRGQGRYVRGRHDLEVLEGAGHFVHLERPVRCAEAIADHLRRCGDGPPA